MANQSPHSDQKKSPSMQPSGKLEAAPAGHPAHAHEGTDVAIMPLVMSLVALIVLAIFVLGLTYGIFRATEHAQVSAQDFQSGLTTKFEGSDEKPMVRELPQEPRIQGIPGFHGNNPAQDMQAFAMRNNVELGDPETHKYGYVAAEGDRPARIPVERAMLMLLERKVFKVAGPTSQPASATPVAKPEGVPTDASTPKPAEGSTK
jgi:hypothetical protein